MTNILYLNDSYKKEAEATITAVSGENNQFIILDQTIFYPVSGGQAHDTGTITHEGKTHNVLFVRKTEQGVSHQIEPQGLQAGDKVHLQIDWQRRYTLMRYHTAIHVLSAVIYQETGALTTGNELDVDGARLDVGLDNFTKEQAEAFIQKANAALKQDLTVSTYVLTKEEALADPSLFKLEKKDYIEKLHDVRIVQIGDIDKQADGGTHVRSTREVGTIVLLKTENKGKGRKRMYIGLQEEVRA